MPRYHLNPDLFFVIHAGALCCWDYKNHQQYELELSYVQRLLHIAQTGALGGPEDQELLDADLVRPLDDAASAEAPWGWDALSKIFWVGTSNLPAEDHEQADWASDYVTYCEEVHEAILTSATSPATIDASMVVPLPAPQWSDLHQRSTARSDFDAVLKARRTSRQFAPSRLTLSELSGLLWASFGYIHEPNDPVRAEFDAQGLETHFRRKATASGGCAHPVEAVVLAWHVDDLPPAIYQYWPQDHSLIRTADLPSHAVLTDILQGQDFYEGCPVGIALAADFSKSWAKYHHSRALRMVMLDAGHVAQTFQLVATRMGCETWVTGMFHDGCLTQCLGTPNLAPILFLTAGQGLSKALPKSVHRMLTA